MSIIRAPRSGNFTIIPNETLRDASLSFRARGILAAILSYPDNWKTSAEKLSAAGGEGRDAIRTALKELETAGYVVLHRYRDDKGQWNSDTIVHDTPQVTAADEPARVFSAGEPPRKVRRYKKNDQEDYKKTVETSDPASPSVVLKQEAAEEKPKQTTEAALIVARNWKTPTTQSKAAITLVVSNALAEGFSEEEVTKAVCFLSDNECYVSDYSFGQAIHGKAVNGPNAGKKGPMEADRTDTDYTAGVDGVWHDDGNGGGYWEQKW